MAIEKEEKIAYDRTRSVEPPISRCAPPPAVGCGRRVSSCLRTDVYHKSLRRLPEIGLAPRLALSRRAGLPRRPRCAKVEGNRFGPPSCRAFARARGAAAFPLVNFVSMWGKDSKRFSTRTVVPYTRSWTRLETALERFSLVFSVHVLKPPSCGKPVWETCVLGQHNRELRGRGTEAFICQSFVKR